MIVLNPLILNRESFNYGTVGQTNINKNILTTLPSRSKSLNMRLTLKDRAPIRTLIDLETIIDRDQKIYREKYSSSH